MDYDTPYIHNPTGYKIIVSQGFTQDCWAVYVKKDNESLKRLKCFPLRVAAEECFEDLRQYFGKRQKLLSIEKLK